MSRTPAYLPKDYLEKSDKYQYVYKYKLKKNNKIVYHAYIKRFRWGKYFDNEYDAAKAVDIRLIKEQEPPVNVLKHK